MSSDQHETSTERLLREALGARAARITANDLRPADPPSRGLRSLRPVHTAVVGLLALAAAVIIGVVGVDLHTVAGRFDSSPAGPATSFTFRGVSLRLPPGWTAQPGQQSDQVCLVVPGKAVQPGRCNPYGLSLFAYQSWTEQEDAVWPSKQSLDGKNWSDGPGGCPAWGVSDGGWMDSNPTQYRMTGPVRRTGKVGGKDEVDGTWQLNCSSQPKYSTRVWGLDEYRVFLVASGLRDDYQQDVQSILASMDFTAFDAQAPSPPRLGDTVVGIDGVTRGQSDTSGDQSVEFDVSMTNSTGQDRGRVGLLVGTRGGVVGQLSEYDGKTWQRTMTGSMVNGAIRGSWQQYDLTPGKSVTVKYRLTVPARDIGTGIKLGAWVFPVVAGTDPNGASLLGRAAADVTTTLG